MTEATSNLSWSYIWLYPASLLRHDGNQSFHLPLATGDLFCLFSVDLLTYRAYNPRLFRLQNRLGIEEPEETPSEEKKKSPKSRETTEEKQKRAAASRDKVKEFQKVCI